MAKEKEHVMNLPPDMHNWLKPNTEERKRKLKERRKRFEKKREAKKKDDRNG